MLVGLSTLLASDQHSGADDNDDNDNVMLSFLKTDPGRSRGSYLTTSFSAEAVRKRFDN